MDQALDIEVHCALDTRDALGESPVWSAAESALYRVDILGERVHRWHPETGRQTSWQMPCAAGSIGLRAQAGLVVALRSGFALLDTDSAALTHLVNPEAHTPSNRLNDGKVSPDGRFWAGSMDDRPDKEPVAALYRLDADHACRRMMTGLKVSNGLAWSPDGQTLYLTSLCAEVSAEVLPGTPLAGGVFSLEPGVAGAPVGLYRG